MRILNTKYLIITLLGLIVSVNIEAQFLISTYIDAGENNVSNGLYIKTSVSVAYQFGNTIAEGGSQFDLKRANDNFLTGSKLNVLRKFSIKGFPFEIQGLFLYNTSSDLINESNWGMLVNIGRRHFTYKLGTEFRTYHITQEAVEKYDIESNRNLHENWNLMYLVGYNLNPIEDIWNIGISITNIDHFIINQETNPMVFLQWRYNVSLPLTLYAESWYKSAGTFNISANYFGFFFRAGFIWELKY
jgi:hypothetical protein